MSQLAPVEDELQIRNHSIFHPDSSYQSMVLTGYTRERWSTTWSSKWCQENSRTSWKRICHVFLSTKTCWPSSGGLTPGSLVGGGRFTRGTSHQSKRLLLTCGGSTTKRRKLQQSGPWRMLTLVTWCRWKLVTRQKTKGSGTATRWWFAKASAEGNTLSDPSCQLWSAAHLHECVFVCLQSGLCVFVYFSH